MNHLLRNMIDNIMISDDVRGLARRGVKGAPRGQRHIDDDADEPGIDTQLAYAVLLVDLAMIDEHLDPRESQVITQSLIRLLEIQPQQVGVLVARAKKELAAFRGSSGFGERLGQLLTLEERQELLKAIEDIIMADGVVDGFEVYLHRRFSQLLQLTEVTPLTPTGTGE